MDILAIIKDNLPDDVEITDKTLKAIEKEIKAEQGKEFVPKEQYSKKTDRIIELEAENKDLQGKSADADTYKQKFEDLQTKYDADIAAKEKEYSDYKTNVESEKTTSAITADIETRLLKDGANQKLVKLLLKEVDVTKAEYKDGAVSNYDDLTKSVKESYADVFGTTTTTGAGVATPPAGAGEKPDYVSQLTAARKAGSTQDAIRIKTEAAENGVYLI